MKGKKWEEDRYEEWARSSESSSPLLRDRPYSPRAGPRTRPSDDDDDDDDDEEAVASSAACCRICLERDRGREEIISPCMCKGTQQFVHRSCLDHWRSVKEGFAFSHCTTCKAQYHLHVNFMEGYCWRKMKFRIFVARDVILVFLALQMVIAIIGGIIFLLDTDGKFRSGWDRVFPDNPIPFYYCLGVVAFLVLLGSFGLLVQCTAYGVSSSDSSNTSSSSTSAANTTPIPTETIYCCNGPCIIDSSSESGGDCGGCWPVIVFCVIVFAILGIFYGMIAATFTIQSIWKRHYERLTKRELTKEYVVQDLHGCYTEPKLDRQHEERLVMLKLL